MKECSGSIWEAHGGDSLRVLRCIPTNGIVKNNGELVMGKGVAAYAKSKMPHLPKIFGELVKEHGNFPFIINELGICSFPTKEGFWEESSIELIKRSCRVLRQKVNQSEWDLIFLPRVGCGEGKLSWDIVRQILEKELPEPCWMVFDGAEQEKGSGKNA